MVSRADERPFARWWWTVDRILLAALLLLVFAGVMLSFAASPPAAEKLGVGSYYFVVRHIAFAALAVLLMVTISFMEPRQIRRLALVLFVVALAGLVATLFIGVEVKGARRWIALGGFNIQPAEFVKPGFVILTAFLFAEGERRADLPGRLLALFLLAIVLAPLIAQPDFGQAMLIAMVWSAMIYLAGLQWRWVFALGIAGVGGIVAAYLMLPHVTDRLHSFMDPDSDGAYQPMRALQSITSGGWFGEGPGEGTVKRLLPDSHTDFVFAVTGEEFGIVACGILLFLFAVVVLRGLAHALRETDPFVRLSLSGLTLVFGLQASINMMVNLKLMPAKGMTLPFISYGGSSMLAIAIMMGMMLALARRRARNVRFTAIRHEAFA
jgi:cell division protein FtsW